jgi:hypothetical protein
MASDQRTLAIYLLFRVEMICAKIAAMFAAHASKCEPLRSNYVFGVTSDRPTLKVGK